MPVAIPLSPGRRPGRSEGGREKLASSSSNTASMVARTLALRRSSIGSNPASPASSAKPRSVGNLVHGAISLAVAAAGWVVASHPEITPPSNFHHFRDTTMFTARVFFLTAGGGAASESGTTQSRPIPAALAGLLELEPLCCLSFSAPCRTKHPFIVGEGRSGRL